MEMALQRFSPEGMASPGAPYSLAAKAGNVIYTAGVLALDGSSRVVAAGDIKGQTRYVLEAIEKILKAAGAEMKDVAFNHVFLTDFANYAGMNEVYREFFGDSLPARYCVKADLVREGCLVEIAAVAHTA
jgi:aminoacrylate peracid reductase